MNGLQQVCADFQARAYQISLKIPRPHAESLLLDVSFSSAFSNKMLAFQPQCHIQFSRNLLIRPDHGTLLTRFPDSKPDSSWNRRQEKRLTMGLGMNEGTSPKFHLFVLSISIRICGLWIYCLLGCINLII